MRKNNTRKSQKGGMNFVTYQFTNRYKHYDKRAWGKISKMEKEKKYKKEHNEDVRDYDEIEKKYGSIFYECAMIKVFLEKVKKAHYTLEELKEKLEKHTTIVPYGNWISSRYISKDMILYFFVTNKIYPRNDGNDDEINNDNEIDYTAERTINERKLKDYIDMSLFEFIKAEGEVLLALYDLFYLKEIKRLRADIRDPKSQKYADIMEAYDLTNKINLSRLENTNLNTIKLKNYQTRATELLVTLKDRKKKTNFYDSTWTIDNSIEALEKSLNPGQSTETPKQIQQADVLLKEHKLKKEGDEGDKGDEDEDDEDDKLLHKSGDDSGDEGNVTGGRKRKTKQRKTKRSSKTKRSKTKRSKTKRSKIRRNKNI